MYKHSGYADNFYNEYGLGEEGAITYDQTKATLYVYDGTPPDNILFNSNETIRAYIDFIRALNEDLKNKAIESPEENRTGIYPMCFHTCNLFFLNFDYLTVFNIFFVNKHGKVIQIDRLLHNTDRRFKKHFFIPHNIAKMATAGYFDTLEDPEPEGEVPPESTEPPSEFQESLDREYGGAGVIEVGP